MSTSAPFEATYYDGRSSEGMPVRAFLGATTLTLQASSWRSTIPLARMSAERPIGGDTWIVLLPDGAQLHAADMRVLDALCPASRISRLLSPRGKAWPYACAVLALAVAAIALLLAFELPRLSGVLARALPVAIESRIASGALHDLDFEYCRPSALPEERKLAAIAMWRRLVAGLPAPVPYRLEFRRCPAIGANAFALGGGTVVITDDLVGIATDDREIAAVLAHELGHLEGRHALRTAIEGNASDIALGAILRLFLGDTAGIASFSVELPRALLQAGYSRDLEREADRFAFGRLKAVGIPPRYFAQMLRAIQAQEDAPTGQGATLAAYFSTHPADSDRIAAAMAAR